MSWRIWLGLPTKPEHLAQAMLRMLQRMGHTDWTYSAERNELRNGRDAVINLCNLHLEFNRAGRAERQQLLRKYCAVVDAQAREVPKLWTLAARGIYPVVRSRYDQPLFALHVRAQGHEPPAYSSRPLAESLCIRLVYDFGAGVAHVGDELIDTWGQSFDSALAAALDNLKALPAPQWQPIDDGVWQLASTVSYEESFLLLEKVRLKLPFADDAIFVACNRGVLLAAPASDSAALARLLMQTEQSMQQRPWPQSAELLQHSVAGWKRFLPTGELGVRAEEQQRHERARIYGEQQAALQALYEHTGEDVFVASCGLIRREGDSDALHSWSSWAEGVVTSLPRSDLVALARGNDGEAPPQEMLIVKWSDLLTVCGERLQPEPFDPPRFRTDGFPDQEQWQRLQQLA